MFDTVHFETKTTRYWVFFVLNGLENGNRDYPAVNMDGSTTPDGFYFMLDEWEGNDPEEGPFKSSQDAYEAAQKHLKNAAVLDAEDALLEAREQD